jgi:hypothetical protein
VLGDGAERKEGGGERAIVMRSEKGQHRGPWLDSGGRRVSSGCNIGSRSLPVAPRERLRGTSRVHNTNAHTHTRTHGGGEGTGRKYPLMRWSIPFR